MKNTSQSKNTTSQDTSSLDFHLPENHVHIWRASLEMKKPVLARLQNILSRDEIARVERLSAVELKKSFIVSRGGLRLLVARYLGLHPKELCFQYDSHGKPSISAECNQKHLNFSLSHSHNIVLYGVATKRAIGVDVEKIRSDLSYKKIACRQFTQSELLILQKSPANKKIQTFFMLWTQKEAVLKALGKGFFFPMNQFDVSDAPGKPVTFLTDSPERREIVNCFVEDLHIGSGFCAALAAEGKTKTIKIYNAPVNNIFEYI